MDIIKDVENVAEAGASIQSRLIVIFGVAAVLCALAVALANHFEDKGRQLERVGWLAKEVQEKKDDAALVEQHHQEMNELEKHHLLIERQTSEDHEQEISKLRRDRAADRADADRRGGLRIPAPACPAAGPVQDGPGTEAAGAGGRDEASAATVRLPQQVENDLWAITDDADEVSAQLRACQSWIRANGFYGPPVAEKLPLLDRMVADKNQHTEAEQ